MKLKENEKKIDAAAVDGVFGGVIDSWRSKTEIDGNRWNLSEPWKVVYNCMGKLIVRGMMYIITRGVAKLLVGGVYSSAL